MQYSQKIFMMCDLSWNLESACMVALWLGTMIYVCRAMPICGLMMMRVCIKRPCPREKVSPTSTFCEWKGLNLTTAWTRTERRYPFLFFFLTLLSFIRHRIRNRRTPKYFAISILGEEANSNVTMTTSSSPARDLRLLNLVCDRERKDS